MVKIEMMLARLKIQAQLMLKADDGCKMLLCILSYINITYVCYVIFLWAELSEVTSCNFVAYYALFCRT